MESDKESQRPVLPKDLFRNGLTWILYEIFKHYFPSVVSCTFCVITWVAFSMDAFYQNVPGLYMIGRVVFESAINFPLGWLYYSKSHPDTTLLVQQVLKSNPGLDIEKWDEIANRLNSSFYQEHMWNTPYFFYDGQQGQLAFRNNVLRPYLEGKFEDISDKDKIQSAKFYLQSINENFKLSLKDNLPESFLNSELPRDTYRNKSMLHSRHLFMGIIFLRRQYQILLGIVMGLFQKSFFSLFCCIFWDQIFSRDNWSFYWLVYPEMGIMQGIKFLAIITKVSPGEELDKWDQIARYMNQYLSEEYKHLPNNNFFDGKHCLDCYQACFKPLSVGNSLVYGELKEIVEFTKRRVE
ncbi:ZYRO0D00242p [Zygosaccharomyces rouxii]|uniref:ZYRO0D00242p n=1 Tax=Zygosaccharomyces rouxii (strain ATCC 2623 / CBS 732 / NBRC 1130 / NCYC 568 / NRRL Y-229) TaxID=559307 RepID=C5DWW2_ZYGRC|nr:uncharacterized protein ZYRO0D00242g [Zygosaccharomyces rouxii]KAH9200430.1 hypothetical protein LQ764DRAFT_94833 [Zygosaccharomyces rouxii]CAR27513.1 ZYRO0D00242p [Zygosaccharomyces rouxii]